MRRIRVLSFDLEGTLVDNNFSRLVWEEGLPALYAEEKGISLESALKRVMEEYDKIGPERIEWYDLRYWFRRFELRADWRSLLERFKDSVGSYPEIRGVLDRLSRDHDLIIVSNTSRDFMDFQMKQLNSCFKRVFSAPTDYGSIKSPELYIRICSELGVKPQEMVHMGDHRRFDFTAPKEVGITAFFLDRSGKEQGEYVIRDLEEFELRLSELRSLTS
jgi:HAD superfamily hydrolase (TIGR01549 family)